MANNYWDLHSFNYEKWSFSIVAALQKWYAEFCRWKNGGNVKNNTFQAEKLHFWSHKCLNQATIYFKALYDLEWMRSSCF